VDLVIDLNLVEQSQVTKRPKQLARENRSEIDDLFGSVIKRYAQHIVANNPEVTDTMDRMLHVCSLQGGDRKRGFAPLQTPPISHQFILM
jgi:hypothetical protein